MSRNGWFMAAALWCIAWSVSLAAQEPEEMPLATRASECRECVRIDAIVIEGIARTRRSVVERELTVQEGDIARPVDLELSVQQLRNTRLFLDVEVLLEEPETGSLGVSPEENGEPPGRLMRVVVSERWTLSPSFRFGSGGQTFQLALGVQDINLGGRYLQAGVEYSRLGETNSFAAWFQEPRIFGSRQQILMDVSLTNRQQSFYDSEGTLEGGYLLTRRRVGAHVQREWMTWLRTGVSGTLHGDTFSYENVNLAREEGQETRGGLPGPMQVLRVGVDTTLGRVNEVGYRWEGTELRLFADQHAQFGVEERFRRRLRATFRHFSLLPRESNLALRSTVSLSDQEIEHLQLYAGGLETIRGVPDMRFRGRHLWTANVEYRIPSLQLPWLVLQHVAFVDAVGDSPFATTLLQWTAATAGLGLRIFSPQIHNLLIRADMTLPVMGTTGVRFSFGAGQFF